MTLGRHAAQLEVARAAAGVEILRKRIDALTEVQRNLDPLLAGYVNPQFIAEMSSQTRAIRNEVEQIFGQTVRSTAKEVMKSVEILEASVKISGPQRRRATENKIAEAKDAIEAGILYLNGKISAMQPSELQPPQTILQNTENYLNDRNKEYQSKIFVVHGHDEGAREGVARFLEKLGLIAIILAEQPNRGRTIIEKFVDYAGEVGFAVVLLTPDDLGGATADEAQKSRGRQNVIFELGYFVGSLGRGRACLLRKGEVEIPSDLYGVIYTAMDSGNGWKLALAKELKDAGFEFDADKVLT
jgi:predicted nucleotide-binding protein